MAVKNQLKNDQDFKSLEEKDDVVGLLDKLRAKGVRYRYRILGTASVDCSGNLIHYCKLA